jgi:hypothetical protein
MYRCKARPEQSIDLWVSAVAQPRVFGTVMMQSARSRIWLIVALLASTTAARAEGVGDQENYINFAFATWIGSGVYRMRDRNLAVLRLPMSWEFREAEKGRPGYKVLFPVILGSDKSDDFDDRVTTLSFVPGLEVSFMMRPRWLIKPYAQAGIGNDFANGSLPHGNFAHIYGAGIKNLNWIDVNDYRVSFGLGGLLAGSRVRDGGNREKFSKIDLGIDVGRETGIRMFDRNLRVNTFYTLSYFANDVEFPQADEEPGRIEVLHEIGLTFSGNPEVEIAGISGLRGGFGYSFGSNNFRGLSLNAGFPF